MLRNLEGVHDALTNYRRAHNLAVLVAELDDVELRYLDAQLGGASELGELAELAVAAPSLSRAVVVFSCILPRSVTVGRVASPPPWKSLSSALDERTKLILGDPDISAQANSRQNPLAN